MTTAQALTGPGPRSPSRKQSRGLNSTGDDCIKNENAGIEGYIVDNRGRIRGEAKRYDPYSRWGEVMLYEIDAFGFLPGYISKNWQIMSKEDILSDRRLARRFVEVKYQTWKRYNIIDLIAEYDRMFKDRDHFERFCKIAYKDVLEKEKKIDF